MPWPETHQVLRRLRDHNGLERVLSGMAQGFDQIGAQAALNLGLALDAVVPFRGQEKPWPPSARARYRLLLVMAAAVTQMTELPEGVSREERDRAVRAAMGARNRWMVDKAPLLLACWRGDREGGTWQTVAYARRCDRPIIVMDPVRRTVTWPPEF